MLREFQAFLIKQNVLSLAIAVLVGTALNSLVEALVADFIMPVVGAALPSGEWETATLDVGPVQFGVGHFTAVLLNFVIVGFVAWRLAKAFIAPDKPEKATTRNCPFCLMSIDKAATRCAHCTSQITPPAEAAA